MLIFRQRRVQKRRSPILLLFLMKFLLISSFSTTKFLIHVRTYQSLQFTSSFHLSTTKFRSINNNNKNSNNKNVALFSSSSVTSVSSSTKMVPDTLSSTPTAMSMSMSMSTSASASASASASGEKSKSKSKSNKFPLSNRIIHTLDPCVVKTKEWIQKYTPLWETDQVEEENGNDDGRRNDGRKDGGGIFSLAQGVVYWKPPPSCSIALKDAIMSMSINVDDDDDDDGNNDNDDSGNDDNNDDDDPLSLHSYSPAQGIPELVNAIEEKIHIEHGMINHDVTVTVGANQAYMNCVLTIMGDNSDNSNNSNSNSNSNSNDNDNDNDNNNNNNSDNNKSSNNNNNNNTNKAVVFAPYYFNHVMAIQMCCGDDSVVVGPTDMNTGYPNIEWLKQTLELENSSGGEGSSSSNSNNSNSNNIRMVTIVNPGNPTGIALSYEHVKEIIDLCKQYGIWVILDCTYEHFLNTSTDSNNNNSSSNNNNNSNAEEEKEKVLPTFANESHVIHIFSFSKGYSLAGYRCGYLISHKNAGTVNGGGGECGGYAENNGHDAADADVGKEGNGSSSSAFLLQMLKVQDTIPIGPPRISQHIALGALRGSGSGSGYCTTSKEWVYRKYSSLDTSREYILNAISSSLTQTLGGSGSMYVMGKLPDGLDLSSIDKDDNDGDDDNDDKESSIDVKFCRLLIKYYGVAAIPGSFCGLPGWIRICYANLPPAKTKVAAKRLKKGIDELCGNDKNIIIAK